MSHKSKVQLDIHNISYSYAQEIKAHCRRLNDVNRSRYNELRAQMVVLERTYRGNLDIIRQCQIVIDKGTWFDSFNAQEWIGHLTHEEANAWVADRPYLLDHVKHEYHIRLASNGLYVVQVFNWADGSMLTIGERVQNANS